MKLDVLAIGNPVYDIIITPKARSKGRILSGCSTNALLALSKLGFKNVALVGCIGRDYLSKIKADLAKYDIKRFHFKISCETGGFKLIYDEKGDRELYILGVAGKIDIKDIPEEFLNAKYVLIGPILQEVDLKLIKYLRETTNAIIFLDPQGLVRRVIDREKVIRACNREEIKAVLQYVDYCKPNEHESVVMTGEKDPFKAVRLLVEWGSRIGIVTLAERGSVAYNGKHYYKIPAYRTEAIDPTGAGDVYAGSLIAALLQNYPLPKALLYASACASVMVEHIGPDFPLTREEALRRFKAIERNLMVY